MENLSADASVIQPDNGNPGAAGFPAQPEEEVIPRCFCGAGVKLWSSLLEQGFCSEEHYEERMLK